VDYEGAPMIDARGLHQWLGVSERFADWMKRRLTDYRFEEGADWVFPKFQKNSTTRGGRPLKEYLITPDMAKELAMIERTEIGRHTRRYFIKMEKAALERLIQYAVKKNSATCAARLQTLFHLRPSQACAVFLP
jgi:anti-repressor protein